MLTAHQPRAGVAQYSEAYDGHGGGVPLGGRTDVVWTLAIHHSSDVNNAWSYTSISPYAKLCSLIKQEVALLLSKNKQFIWLSSQFRYNKITFRFFYRCPAYGSCHEMYRMIKPPSPVQRRKTLASTHRALLTVNTITNRPDATTYKISSLFFNSFF